MTTGKVITAKMNAVENSRMPIHCKIWMPPNSPAIQGIPAIRQLWTSLLAAGYRNATLEFDEIQHWGDVALVIGRYAVEISSIPGTPEVDRGSYVGHWRRMADGQFRVTLSIWSSDRWHHTTPAL